MKKVMQYKGFIIATDKKQPDRFILFTKDEYVCGEGYRYPEWDAGTIEEAKQWIDCY